MRTITITQPRPISGAFEVNHQGSRFCGSTVRNAGEAAAKALEYRFLEVGEYIIVGHDLAMQYIPDNLRTGVNK